MKLCNSCKNLGKKSKCKYYGIGSNYAERCTDYEEIKPTNAQKIRSMSDEELAEFIPYALDVCCNPTEECMKYFFDKGECIKTNECVMQWLKSEAKE